jgi:hypothetical protein
MWKPSLNQPTEQDRFDKISFGLHKLLGEEDTGLEGIRAIELGAGHCKLTEYLEDTHGMDVTPVDITDKRVPDFYKWKFVEKDVNAISEAYLAEFDVIIIAGLLYHLDSFQQQQLLKKCNDSTVPILIETHLCRVHTGAYRKPTKSSYSTKKPFVASKPMISYWLKNQTLVAFESYFPNCDRFMLAYDPWGKK